MKQVNTENFEDEVIHAGCNVVVEFYADWCAPCKMLMPVLTSVADENKDQIKFVRINIDENENIASQYRILSIPTLLFFKEGGIVGKVEGAVPKNLIEQKISKYFK